MNERLRQHVTRVGFDLTLGKTHIAALVYLDYCIRHRVYLRTASHTPFQWFATGARGLEERGLLVHHYEPREQRPKNAKDHLGRHYTITPAGKLVIGLLKEAGIWQEYEATLPIETAHEGAA